MNTDQLPQFLVIRDRNATPFTHADRARLSNAAAHERLAWAAMVVDRCPPQPVRLKPAEMVAVEALLSSLAQSSLKVLYGLHVGRVAIFVYRPRFHPPDPAIPVAFPLLQIPDYRRAIMAILEAQRPFHELSWERFSKIVEWAVSVIIRAAPRQLGQEELAFAMLSTSHLLSDPSGLGLIENFVPRGTSY